MAKSALIEELEKQFNENPRRVFARLANEYRKAGELELSIDICRTHIPQQPSYISGYIVLGQALFESQNLAEAKSTFETALGLDPENLIALRQLGDIARVQGDSDSARAWYQRLLEVDPQNEEAAAQLESLAPPEPVSTPNSGGGSPFDEFGWREIHPEDHSTDSTAEEPSEPEPREAEPAVTDDMPAWLRPEPMPASDAVADREPVDLDRTPVMGMPAVAEEASSERAAPHEDPLDIDLADAIPEAAAASVPSDAFGEMLDLGAPAEEALSEPAVEAHEVAGAQPREPAEPGAPSELPPTFVTETMAELYLQQGFSGEALRIYRQLIVQRPDDQSLRDKVQAIEEREFAAQAGLTEGAPAGGTIRDFFTRIARMRAPATAAVAAEPPAEPIVDVAPPPAPMPDERPDEYETPVASLEPVVEEVPLEGADTLASFDVLDIEELAPAAPPPPAEPVADAPSVPAAAEPASAGGGSAPAAGDLFAEAPVSPADDEAARALSSAFDDFLSESGAAGQPAREASSELSLDSVFRDASSPAPAARPNGAMSFDDFFSEENGESRNRGEQRGEAGDAGPSDLETFHAWLEGLKK